MQIPAHSHEARLAAQIGRAIRTARRRQKLTQEDLAVAAGVSVRTLSSIEKGAPGARMDGVVRTLRAVGLTLEIVDSRPSEPPPSGSLS